ARPKWCRHKPTRAGAVTTLCRSRAMRPPEPANPHHLSPFEPRLPSTSRSRVAVSGVGSGT
ncbi:hypothetical protein ABZW47_18270, partial [Streptomyces sp. NPDC004549]